MITDKQVSSALYAFQTWQGWCSVGGEGLARAKMRAALEAAEAGTLARQQIKLDFHRYTRVAKKVTPSSMQMGE